MSIYLIRHAQSNFNKAAETLGPAAFQMKEYIDARLSENGIKQAMSASENVKNINFKYVYVSPYRRTLETAQLIFDKHPSNPKFIVEPLCKEFTTASCDIPEHIDVTTKEFPQFDFRPLDRGFGREFWWLNTLNPMITSLLLRELNTRYPNKEDMVLNMKYYLLDRLNEKFQFETIFEGRERAKRVQKFVKDHANKIGPNEKIAIVSHYVFLRQFTATKFNEKGIGIDAKNFENCEVYEYKF